MQQTPGAAPSGYIPHSKYIMTLCHRRGQLVQELHHVEALLRLHGVDEPEEELSPYEEEDVLEDAEFAFPNAAEILGMLRALPEKMADSAERDGAGNIRYKGILLKALKVVAHCSGGYVRYQPAKALIRQAGLSNATDRNLNRSLMDHLTKDNGHFREILHRELYEWKEYLLTPQADAETDESLGRRPDDPVPEGEEPGPSCYGSPEEPSSLSENPAVSG